MAATPTTTKLGPDQAQLKHLMRRLADAASTDAPILSVYADVRPEAHGERPAERKELTVVRDRLDAIADTLEPHTTARESFDTSASARKTSVILFAGSCFSDSWRNLTASFEDAQPVMNGMRGV